MSLYPNQILRQRYQIQSLLGQGGFGAVYKGIDLNLNRWCAVKENILDPTLTQAQLQAQQQQFQREAMMLSRLQHPNLPRVHDYFIEANGQQYLIMEFVEGQDLHTLVQQRGALPELQAVTWIRQILDALEYLHSHQPPIIHRDIKPQNIIITPQGRAMLVDFGIAKMFVAGQATTIGARAVSPGYSPPEQYGQGSTDPRSDIYAVGATMYFVLTGEEPPESVQRVAGAVMTLPRAVNVSVSAHTEQVILQAMQLQPQMRFQNAAQVRQTLATLIQQPPIPMTVSSPRAHALPPHMSPTVAPRPISQVPSKAYLLVPIFGGNLLALACFVVSLLLSVTAVAVVSASSTLPSILGLIGLLISCITWASPFFVGIFSARRHRQINNGQLSFGEALFDGSISGMFSQVGNGILICLLLVGSFSTGNTDALSNLIVIVILPFAGAIVGAIGGLVHRGLAGP